MSRVGKEPIPIPEGISVALEGNTVTLSGKLGTLSQDLSPEISAQCQDAVLTVVASDQSKRVRALQGLYRALLNNMVEGVSKGFSKELELVGVGYRASSQGQLLDLSLGFSHNVVLQLPEAVSVETKMEKGKNPYLKLSSYDKQLLGMVAAKVRSLRKPEPYKGKGARFVGEQIRRKAGKSA